jgi:cephalosporin hydroxylase
MPSAGTNERFQRFSRRRFTTSLCWDARFLETMKAAKWSTNGKVGVLWRGVRMVKDPFTSSLYASLLWELRPKTIIELGTFEGGSALWLADIATALGVDATVVSFDKDVSRVKVSHPKISFRQLDVFDINQKLDVCALRTMPRPFLVLEDVHINLLAVLNCLFALLDPGDYLVVEDTCDPKKYGEFARFMDLHRDSLYVDSHYTDNFGYNSSFNWNSFLRYM